MEVKTFITASVISTALGLGSATALAQQAGESDPYQPPAQQQQQGQEQQQGQVTDSELALYVQASEKVNELQLELQQEMQQAKSTEEAQEIQQEGQQELVNAVESFGMSVEEYNRITQLAQTNPDIRARLQSMLE